MAAQDLGTKMDTLIRLTALQLIGDKTGAEAVGILDRAGLDNELIADIVGTTAATVRAARSRVRRKGATVQRSNAPSAEEV
jgi:hypothetical protein